MTLRINAEIVHLQYEARGIDTHESFAIGISAREVVLKNALRNTSRHDSVGKDWIR